MAIKQVGKWMSKTGRIVRCRDTQHFQTSPVRSNGAPRLVKEVLSKNNGPAAPKVVDGGLDLRYLRSGIQDSLQGSLRWWNLNRFLWWWKNMANLRTYLNIPHLVWWCFMLFISKCRVASGISQPSGWLPEGNTVFIEHLWLIVNSWAPVLYFSDLALVAQQTGILGKDSRISRLVRSNTWYILYFKLLQFEWWQTHVAMEPLEVVKVICIGVWLP